MTTLTSLAPALRVIVFNDATVRDVRETIGSLRLSQHAYAKVVCISPEPVPALPRSVEPRVLVPETDYFAIFDELRRELRRPGYLLTLVVRAGAAVVPEVLAAALEHPPSRESMSVGWHAARAEKGYTRQALALAKRRGRLMLPLEVDAFVVDCRGDLPDQMVALDPSLVFFAAWELLVRLESEGSAYVYELPGGVVERCTERSVNPVQQYYDHLTKTAEVAREQLPESQVEWDKLQLMLHAEVVREHPSFFADELPMLLAHLRHEASRIRGERSPAPPPPGSKTAPLMRLNPQPLSVPAESPRQARTVPSVHGAKPLRVLLLSSYSPFHELTGGLAAGAENALRAIGDHLARRGHIVHYLCLGDEDRDLHLGGVNVHLRSREEAHRRELTTRGVASGMSMASALMARSGKLLRALEPSSPLLRALLEGNEHVAKHAGWGFRRHVDGVVQEHGVDVIHSFSSFPDAHAAALVSAERRVPLVIRMGGRFWFLKYSAIPDEHERARYRDDLRFVFGTCACLLFNSAAVRRDNRRMFDKLGLAAPAKEHVLDIGISPPQRDFVDHEALRTFARFGTGRWIRAVAVGKFKSNSKRQDLLIDALARVRREVPLKLFLVGDGPLRESAAARASELGVSDDVVFLGTVPRNVVFDILRQADMLVHATEYEGASKALSEAMLCGCPVVASDIPAVREHVRSGDNGLVVPNSSEAFAQAMARIATNRELAMSLAASARTYASEVFDAATNVAGYETLFRELVGHDL